MIFAWKLCRTCARLNSTIFWNYTYKNIPDRQHGARFRKSPKKYYSITPPYCIPSPKMSKSKKWKQILLNFSTNVRSSATGMVDSTYYKSISPAHFKEPIISFTHHPARPPSPAKVPLTRGAGTPEQPGPRGSSCTEPVNKKKKL